jgi:hypothetical protein
VPRRPDEAGRQCIMGHTCTSLVHGLFGAPPVGAGWEFLVELMSSMPEPLEYLCLLRLLFLGGVKDDDRAGVGVEGPDCLEPLVPVEVVPSEQTPPPSWRCDSVGVHPKEDNF